MKSFGTRSQSWYEQEAKPAPKETATTPVAPKATPATPTPNKTETETQNNPAASAAVASATPIK